MREFDIINKLLRPLAGKDSDGLGDDCAFFEGWCVTKDVLVSGVHFFPDDAAFNLARKSLRVNLSDLASSGAVPFGVMLGLVLPRGLSEDWLTEFARGLEADLKEFGVQLLGGDTTSHDGGLVISVTAIGRAERPVTRGGAKVGDNVFVSGAVGKGVLGLRAKGKGIRDERYELPNPRVDLVPVMQKYASACIDISDGLLADLGHICRESGVGAELDSSAIPLAGEGVLLELLSGGDDYELVFTSVQEEIAGCYRIGRIVVGESLLLDGKMVENKGYEHRIFNF